MPDRCVARGKLGLLLAPVLGLAMVSNAQPADDGRQRQALADQGDDDDAEGGEQIMSRVETARRSRP